MWACIWSGWGTEDRPGGREESVSIFKSEVRSERNARAKSGTTLRSSGLIISDLRSPWRDLEVGGRGSHLT